ncbi:MAG: S-adenosylmethionine:tRNA ribosyltransferase-isomerase, partial [Actinomycetota bacterium]|nr:S-adenosylmethionine:tRNA ribosyltransferase-isomerase [Actinomycetota bacterium]
MSEFEYQLPSEQIAQRPVEPRDSARLLVDRGAEADPVDRHVRDLAFMVGPGDVVVMNETRVISARLRLTKDTGGAAEVLLLEPVRDGVWTALVKPSRRVRDGTSMRDATGRVLVKVRPGGDEGQRLVEVAVDGVPIVDAMGAVALDGLGEAPLPPYITERLDDPERYQTV